jgi:hypothetical protein
MKAAFVGSVLLIGIASGAPADSLGNLIAVAKPAGETLALANEYVRVTYAWFEYPPAEGHIADARPLVLYIRVAPRPGLVNARLLEPPPKGRPSWRLGAVPRAIHIEVLKPPPRPSTLGEPSTDPPRDAVVEERRDGVQLVLATFQPFNYGVGTGRLPSVTTFLSDGVVEVSSHGLRRRVGVVAGDAFWFEARTRLTVIDDYPVGAAILQITPR